MNPLRKVAAGGAIVAAAVAGGALGANLLGTANAQTSTTTPSSAAPQQQPSLPAHGTPEHEALEKPVTGDAATKAQDAAVKSVGGGTAGAVTTDARGDGYEVTVTKPDGTQTEVHLDSSYNVMQHGGPGGGNAPGQAPSSTTTN